MAPEIQSIPSAFTRPLPVLLVLFSLLLVSGCILTGSGGTPPSVSNASPSAFPAGGPTIPMQPTVNVKPPPTPAGNASAPNGTEPGGSMGANQNTSASTSGNPASNPNSSIASEQNKTSNISIPAPNFPAPNETQEANDTREAQAREEALQQTQQAQVQAETERLSQISGSASPDPNGGRIRSKVCAVTVLPTRIYVGQESTVAIYANSANNERVTYLCGDEEHLQGYGGIFTDQRICTFNAAGRLRVWLALDGQTCASAPLDVVDITDLSTPQSSCDILSETRAAGLVNSTQTYSAVLEYQNFDPDANLSWNCPFKNMSTTLYRASLDSSDSQSGFLRLDCQYGFDPGRVGSIPVRLDGIPCGDLVSAD
ncbi:MAG: hypothetical protein V1728_03045 [Candidatus Micrarchaeota archaeon]